MLWKRDQKKLIPLFKRSNTIQSNLNWECWALQIKRIMLTTATDSASTDRLAGRIESAGWRIWAMMRTRMVKSEDSFHCDPKSITNVGCNKRLLKMISKRSKSLTQKVELGSENVASNSIKDCSARKLILEERLSYQGVHLATITPIYHDTRVTPEPSIQERISKAKAIWLAIFTIALAKPRQIYLDQSNLVSKVRQVLRIFTPNANSLTLYQAVVM